MYAAGVILVTVFPIRAHPRHGAPWWAVVELVPFHVPLWSFALNVVMFLPFGVLVPLVWPAVARAGRLTALALAASTTVELTQLALWIAVGNYRTVDVNDLIANTAGGALGFGLLRSAPRRARAQDDFQARM